MFYTFLTAYLFIGLIAALVTMRTFPPIAGFRPKLFVRLLASVAFISLWPVLLMLAIWYFVVSSLGQRQSHEPRTMSVDLVATEPIRHLQGTKPR